jgi:glycosyltransferase involved in cell wall biosynthesis
VPDPELTLGLSRIVRAERPDVVHSHNWIVNSALPLRLRTRAGMVLTLHDYSHVCAVKRLMHQGSVCSGPGLLKCLRCAGHHYGPLPGAVTALSTMPARRLKDRSLDAIIAVSTAVAEGNRLDAARVPFKVIPNFIPDQLWAGASDPLALQAGPAELPSEPFLLFVGDLNREKGLHVLLDAYARLPQRPPLVMMGRRCEDTPAALPEGARILTDCPHELVMHAFRRCHAAVAPSVWPDPCPTVVLEAMAAGCPLVTTPVGGIRDMVVDLESGLMVAPGDAGQLFGALQRLLDDKALATRLGQEARRRAKPFTASQVVPRIEDMYRSTVLARRAPAVAPE